MRKHDQGELHSLGPSFWPPGDGPSRGELVGVGGNGSLFNHVTARHVSDMQMEMELGEGIGRLELKGEWG